MQRGFKPKEGWDSVIIERYCKEAICNITYDTTKPYYAALHPSHKNYYDPWENRNYRCTFFNCELSLLLDTLQSTCIQTCIFHIISIKLIDCVAARTAAVIDYSV